MQPPSAAVVMLTGQRDEQGRPLALEDRVAGEVDEDVEVAVGPAANSGLALAGEPDPGAFVDSGGDPDLERALALDPALAAACARTDRR